MDTEKTYGLKKSHAILLFIQMMLIIIGLNIQVCVLVLGIMFNLSIYMLISCIAMIIAHAGILVYGLTGYKKGQPFYFVTVGLFLLAIAVNIVIPFRDVSQRILLTILFGLMCVFPFKEKDYKFTNYLLAIASMFALAFSIYSSITANPNNMGEVPNMFPVVVMYLSIFAPVILVGLFAVAYNARIEREKHEPKKFDA